MSALVGALGSVIGYLGSEVAQVSIFERLLWPERFYNDFNFSVFIKQSLFMTMGGPLHAAALATLDNSWRPQIILIWDYSVQRDIGARRGPSWDYGHGKTLFPAASSSKYNEMAVYQTLSMLRDSSAAEKIEPRPEHEF